MSMSISVEGGELRGDKVDRSPISQTPEDQRIADINWNRYIRARDNGHIDFVEQAKKHDRFYEGDQWDAKDLAKLACTGRPALTINMILPTINTVLGEQANKRAEVNFKPKRHASHETATVLNRLHKQIADDNSYDWKESQVFSDGLIQDRGYFDVRMDYSKNIQGEVKISVEDPMNIVLDPDAKSYNPDDWFEVFKTKWVSIDDIELVFGEKKADLIRNYVDQGQYYGADSIEVYETRFGPDSIATTSTFRTLESGYLPESEVRSIRSVRIIERQYRVFSMVDYFVDKLTGDMKHVPETWDDDRVAEFAKDHNLAMTQRETKRIRWTVSVDRVLLHDSWSPYEEFTVVPYFPYFRRGRPFGMVRNLISPQEQLNKVSSQELHVVNTTANSGWKVPTGSLVNMTLDELEQRGAETGLVIQFNPAAGEPIQIQPNAVPAGLDRISGKSEMHIKGISGISDSMLGYETPEISGAAIQAKQARGQTQLQVPMDNLAFTQQLLAGRVLSLVQQFYTEERVYYVSSDDYGLNPESPEYEKVVINQKEASGEVVNNVTVGTYEVKVTSVPAKDIYNDTQFEEALQLRSVGVMIPDDVIIQYSNLASKYPLAERIRQINGQADPTPEQQEAQKQAQELQTRGIMLELEKVEAEIEKMQSETAKNVSGIDQTGQKMMIDRQLKLIELKLEAQKAANDGITTASVASMKEGAGLRKTYMDNQTRLITSQIRARNDLNKAKQKSPTQ